MPVTINDKIEVLYFDDWIALVINGESVLEGHSLSPDDVIRKLGFKCTIENLNNILDIDGYLDELRKK